MSRIEQLIAELCPDGVEYKKLGEITVIKRGERVTKADIVPSGKYPIISGGTKPLGNYDKYNRDPDTITIAQYGTAGFVDWQYDYFWANDVCYSVYPFDILNNRYLYFTLLKLQDFLYSIRTNAVPAHLPIDKLKSIEIPIPPLPIQQEIVRILDTFTDLDAELQAELEARKKQYEHYRNQLLNFEGKEVEWKTLGEVCVKTENIKWNENHNIDYQYIDLTSVSRDNNKISETQTINSKDAPSRAQQIVLKDDVIFGTTRPTLKRISIIPQLYHNQICSTGFCVLRVDQEKILPMYLFFILSTSSFNSYVEINQEGASYPSISDKKLKQFKIPIPPLSEQEQIVSKLNKFEALVNKELPAEIAARRKQYEYYREKLLTFGPLIS